MQVWRLQRLVAEQKGVLKERQLFTPSRTNPWAGHAAQGESACLSCTKPWIPSPVLYKPRVMIYTYNPSTQKVESKGLEFQVILSYVATPKVQG